MRTSDLHFVVLHPHSSPPTGHRHNIDTVSLSELFLPLAVCITNNKLYILGVDHYDSAHEEADNTIESSKNTAPLAAAAEAPSITATVTLLQIVVCNCSTSIQI